MGTNWSTDRRKFLTMGGALFAGIAARPHFAWAADGDTLRRGRPTLWTQFGVPQGINAGDALLMAIAERLRAGELATSEVAWELAAEPSFAAPVARGVFVTDARRDYTVKVDAYEDVTVPAGTFKAYKLTTRNSFGEVEQLWTVPSLGLSTLKVIRDRPASQDQRAACRLRVLVDTGRSADSSIEVVAKSL